MKLTYLLPLLAILVGCGPNPEEQRQITENGKEYELKPRN